MSGGPRNLIYMRSPAEIDRWVAGDRFVRPIVRRLVRGRRPVGGVGKVLVNLCAGMDLLGLDYEVNLPFAEIRETDRVAVLGRGRQALAGYLQPNPIVAGIGLMTHPREWPTLCSDYPVVRYLQHSEWASRLYQPYFGDRCGVWPVGIDTRAWIPSSTPKEFDFLLYDKVHWDREARQTAFIAAIQRSLSRRGHRVAVIRYGAYREEAFRSMLARSRAMVFLSEHESQGLAYQECLSSGVPILAWDQGKYLDPEWRDQLSDEIRSSSVPYFDERCGEKFDSLDDFEEALERFESRMRIGDLDPRAYILENLTLEGCAARFMEILDAANGP